MKRLLIMLLIFISSGVIHPTIVQSTSIASAESQDQNRLVVFEAFMNSA
jgi:hypothetical protein